MSLTERLTEDLKDAMRAGETVRRDTLRLLLAALKNKRIERGDELSAAEELAVLATAVKTRTDSAEQFENAGRQERADTERADTERAEIEVIKGYLPRELDEEETRALVQRTIDELGLTSKKELGRVMKAVMAEHRGAVDGKLVQRLAAELLA